MSSIALDLTGDAERIDQEKSDQHLQSTSPSMISTTDTPTKGGYGDPSSPLLSTPISVPISPNRPRSSSASFINIGVGVAIPPAYEGGKWGWRSKPPSNLSNEFTKHKDRDPEDQDGSEMEVEKRSEETSSIFRFSFSRPMQVTPNRSNSVAMVLSNSHSRPNTPTSGEQITSNGGNEVKEGSTVEITRRWSSIIQSFTSPSLPSSHTISFRKSYSFHSASLDNLSPNVENAPDAPSPSQKVRATRRRIVRKPNLLPKPRSHSRVAEQLEAEALPPGKDEIIAENLLHRRIASLPGSPAKPPPPHASSTNGPERGMTKVLKNRFPQSWSDAEVDEEPSGIPDDSSEGEALESGIQEEDEVMMDETRSLAGESTTMMDLDDINSKTERRASASSLFSFSMDQDRKGPFWTSYREAGRSSPGLSNEALSRPLKRKFTEDLLPPGSVPFKRRAVSPGASISSISSSPVLSHRHSTPPIPPISLMPLSPQIGYSRSGSPALMSSNSGSGPGVAGGVMAMMFQNEKEKEKHNVNRTPEEEEVEKLKI